MKKQTWFLILSTAFIVILLTCNLMATKQILVLGFVLTAGAFLYPFNFMLGDVITEVFGFKKMRQVIILGFACQLFVSGVCAIGIFLPYPPFFENQEAYVAIFSFVPRIVAASLIAYLFGEFFNAKVLDAMRRRFPNHPFWTRTIGSSLVGQIFDSALFIGIAFFGVVPLDVLFMMIAVQYVVKIGVEATLGTPMAYALRHLIHKTTKDETLEKLGGTDG